MNPGLDLLQPYPFERLNQLTAGVANAAFPRISLTIGEPQHSAPPIVLETLRNQLEAVQRYPNTRGLTELRRCIAQWLARRFKLPELDPERHVLPVNGTREALFAIAQTLVTPGTEGRVICPNPFYQIYEGAAFLAGTTPRFLGNTIDGKHPDFAGVSSDDWQRCELLYICNPGNPSGAVLPIEQLQRLIELAEQHNFVIASDECYSEIYPDDHCPPTGLLEASAQMGRDDHRHCLVFHSLSKRSNLPGLRSGFVAGDPDLITRFSRYRTYHGCAMPLHHQRASMTAWSDEQHVHENRQRYREKFRAVVPLLKPWLDVETPDAGFYLWPATPVDDERFAIELIKRANVAVLPGRYLARELDGFNPGINRVRMALVADLDDCVSAAERIVEAIKQGW